MLWIIKCRAIAGLLRPNLLFLVNSIKMSVRTPYSFTVGGRSGPPKRWRNFCTVPNNKNSICSSRFDFVLALHGNSSCLRMFFAFFPNYLRFLLSINCAIKHTISLKGYDNTKTGWGGTLFRAALGCAWVPQFSAVHEYTPHFYFGLIEGFEPKTCNVKVKVKEEE